MHSYSSRQPSSTGNFCEQLNLTLTNILNMVENEPKKSCFHACAYVPFLQGDTAVIFAYGETDGFSYHMSRRGAVGVHFLSGQRGETPGAKTVQFLINNVSNPACANSLQGFACSTKLINCISLNVNFAKNSKITFYTE